MKVIRVKNKNVVAEIERRMKVNAAAMCFQLQRSGSKPAASVDERRYRLVGEGRFVDRPSLVRAYFPLDGAKKLSARERFSLAEINGMMAVAKHLEDLALANHECLGIRMELQDKYGSPDRVLDEFEASIR